MNEHPIHNDKHYNFKGKFEKLAKNGITISIKVPQILKYRKLNNN